MNIHKPLSGDRMYGQIREGMAKIAEHRPMNVSIALEDALMSGLALFALKDPSLLAFEERRAAPKNLRRIFGIGQVPSDTQMRTILDGVEPATMRPLYKRVFSQLEQGKVLEEMRFLDRYYLLSLDGTKYFSSPTVHCDACLERKNTRTGAITYSHQLLGAAIVHPEHKAVIPLAPEPIIKQDGDEKNDCERNAAKRFFEKLRQDHPHLPLIVVEDALSSNAPHIEELKRHKLRFILGVKPGDDGYLFAHVAQARAEGRTTEFELRRDGVIHRFHFLNDVPLNESNA
ncbi:MAG: transposase, partial [Nitrospirota bacterium]|nr:transposase [Nitrospirota bacterium]